LTPPDLQIKVFAVRFFLSWDQTPTSTGSFRGLESQFSYANLNPYPNTSTDTPTFGAFLRPYPLTIFAVDGGEVKVLVSCAGLRESFLELSKGIGTCDDIKGLYKPQDSVGYKI